MLSGGQETLSVGRETLTRGRKTLSEGREKFSGGRETLSGGRKKFLEGCENFIGKIWTRLGWLTLLGEAEDLLDWAILTVLYTFIALLTSSRFQSKSR